MKANSVLQKVYIVNVLKFLTLLFMLSNKILVIRLEFTKCLSEKQTGKTLIRPHLQKQSDLGLHCLSSSLGPQIVFETLEHLPYVKIPILT